MSKKIDEYNKKNWLHIVFRLKPEEVKKLNIILKEKNLSRRKYLIEKMNKEEVLNSETDI